jgi:hypothetical protein
MGGEKMKTTVRKWAFNLVLLSLMASCGGDNNATGSNTVNNNDNLKNGVSSATGTETYSGFISKVEEGHFEGQSVDRDFFFQKVSSGTQNSNCDTLWGVIEYCSFNSGSGYTSGSYRVRGIDQDGNVLYREGLDGIDTFGDSLSEIKSRLLSRMKSASKVYKCLNLGFGEQCYTENQWRQLYLSSQQPYYYGSNYLSKDPRKAKSSRWIFENGGFTYLVDLKRPLGAQPVGIMKDGETFMSYD